ncbi:IS110 family transposase [Micromonospora sp. ATCC 39149]|uniref:IS110 family transposase n=1 Tax=Micromonospora sp. (strain ATCC 39149 / NRRL 15099 / SCC 1413) TaxID=219305 RepID=UPI001E444812|nr:IS110 family transposase [Micromonospora sp. ATCC 39149]
MQWLSSQRGENEEGRFMHGSKLRQPKYIVNRTIEVADHPLVGTTVPSWAVEGGNGIGRHVAQRLVADGETVVDVPAKLSARARVFATGQGRKTDPVDARSVAVVACAPKARGRSSPTSSQARHRAGEQHTNSILRRFRPVWRDRMVGAG